jgi:hypothetical protein
MSLPENSAVELLKGAIDLHKTITLRALDVVPLKDRVIVYILAVFFSLAFVAGVIFALGQQWPYALTVFIVAFVCIGLVLFVLVRPAQASTDQIEKWIGPISRPMWTRVFPMLPIPEESLGRFQLSLRLIREKAISILNMNRKKSGTIEIADDKFRINVFLVQTDQIGESGSLTLIIPRWMHDNMARFKDRGIRFLPHEGLTGRTFSLGEAGGAKATSESASGQLAWSRVDVFPTRPSNPEWDRFTLSDEQKALIEGRVRWIVSFPLKYKPDGRDSTFGVLCIDGLDIEVVDEELRLLATDIEPYVNQLASDLAELPKTRVTIRAEDQPHTP